MRNCQRPLGVRQKVGQACDEADVDVGLELLQGLKEDAQIAAGQHLSALKTWMGTTASLVDVAADIRITQKSENSDNLRI